MAAEVFVSYARKDREQIQPWVKQLQEAGVSLWLDERDIDGAHLWTQEIIEAIRACTVLLLMLSPASAASEHVVREVTFALEQHKRILPLVLEPVQLPSSLQYPLTGLQQIELFHGDPEQKRTALLRALTRLGVAAPAWQATGLSAPTASGDQRPASSRPQHNLPRSLTRFIGREQQVAEVTARLATTPVLTLTGTGGLGKTRLALQVATEVLPDYLDGVWLVELAALSEPSLVPQQVATALGVREEPGRALIETLTEYLQPRQLLLVLDNCEHLVGACASLAQRLLSACPDLRVLATSREALNVPGETLFRVPALTTPIPPPPPVEQLTQYEAVRLFIDRAVLSQPAFAVTNTNAPAVAEVCHRLDGIPLAIELAAARVKALPVEQIAARLDDRFKLLTGGSRTALPRQQTLRALIDWSYELLTEPERTLLRRVSVFAGGWGLEAAEAVCAGEEIEAGEVLDLLMALVEKSLVQYEETEGAGRYRLLETIRQYGAEKLQGLGEEAVWRGGHRDWFLGLAEEAAPQLHGAAQGEWFRRLEREHDNLRAALGWCITEENEEAALRFAWALLRLWLGGGYFSEGRALLTRVLSLGGGGRTAARAKALHGAAGLADRQGDYEAARSLAQESLEIGRELKDNTVIGGSLNTLGNISRVQGDYEAARRLFEEALAFIRETGGPVAAMLYNLGNVASDQGDYPVAKAFYEEADALDREQGHRSGMAFLGLGRVASLQGDYPTARRIFEEDLRRKKELGHPLGIAEALGCLGSVESSQGDYEAAHARYEESLAIYRQLGDQRGIAGSLGNLGIVASNQGEYEGARALCEEGLAIFRQLGDQQGVACSLGNLGIVARDQGEYEGARALYEESLAIFRQLGDQQSISSNLEDLATVVSAQGQPKRAARLFGAAEALRAAIGSPLPPSERAGYDRRVDAVGAALGEAAFAAAWAQGRALSLEQAIALALDEAREA